MAFVSPRMAAQIMLLCPRVICRQKTRTSRYSCAWLPILLRPCGMLVPRAARGLPMASERATRCCSLRQTGSLTLMLSQHITVPRWRWAPSRASRVPRAPPPLLLEPSNQLCLMYGPLLSTSSIKSFLYSNYTSGTIISNGTCVSRSLLICAWSKRALTSRR